MTATKIGNGSLNFVPAVHRKRAVADHRHVQVKVDSPYRFAESVLGRGVMASRPCGGLMYVRLRYLYALFVQRALTH